MSTRSRATVELLRARHAGSCARAREAGGRL